MNTFCRMREMEEVGETRDITHRIISKDGEKLRWRCCGGWEQQDTKHVPKCQQRWAEVVVEVLWRWMCGSERGSSSEGDTRQEHLHSRLTHTRAARLLRTEEVAAGVVVVWWCLLPDARHCCQQPRHSRSLSLNRATNNDTVR